jgi:hypothetical protein
VNIRTLALSALLYAAPAHALSLHGGSWAFDEVQFASGPVQLVGGHGFSFTGIAYNARVDAADCGFGCAPRERVSLFMIVNGGDLPGVATLRDRDFTDVGGPNSTEQLNLEVHGTSRAPRLRGATERTTTALGRIGGEFYYATVPFEAAVEELRGDVIVTIHWHRPEWDAEHWYITAIDYDVVPR